MTAAGQHIGTRQSTAREADTAITSGLKAGANRPRRIASVVVGSGNESCPLCLAVVGIQHPSTW
jgi:hypothetical protein